MWGLLLQQSKELIYSAFGDKTPKWRPSIHYLNGFFHISLLHSWVPATEVEKLHVIKIIRFF